MGDCCQGDCPPCQEKAFTTTFYFDNHQIQITGCAEACGEAESLLGAVLKDRIPKLKE
jgi:hypothetical protein